MTGRLEGGSPGATTHWSAAAMPKDQSISVKFGANHLARACLQPHRMRPFELSNDPQFATRLRDIVGLYMDPPAMLSFSRSTKRTRYRHSIARSRACRSRKAVELKPPSFRIGPVTSQLAYTPAAAAGTWGHAGP
jgi:hypothetical protein